MRYSAAAPYNGTSLPGEDWNARIQPENGFTSPWSNDVDRQVALAELFNVTQGRYRCANNGNCVAPDTCACAKGWMGFDCRVPICEQGYYEDGQPTFVKGTNDERELEIFQKFMGQNQTYWLNPVGAGYANPVHNAVVERIVNGTFVRRSEVKRGGVSYLHKNSSLQGGYECSIRAVTEWEDYRSGMLLEHPNYFSSYMDQKTEEDGKVYTHWEAMGWEPTYQKSTPLEMHEMSLNVTNDTDRVFIYTDEGYRRRGEWSRTASEWTKGRCIIEFKRVCDDHLKANDLEAAAGDGLNIQEFNLLVQDTDLVSVFSPVFGTC